MFNFDLDDFLTDAIAGFPLIDVDLYQPVALDVLETPKGKATVIFVREERDEETGESWKRTVMMLSETGEIAEAFDVMIDPEGQIGSTGWKHVGKCDVAEYAGLCLRYFNSAASA